MITDQDAERCLDQDYLKECVSYDKSTGVFTWNATRRGTISGKVAGSLNKGNGYREIMIDRISYLEHRLAWLYVYGEWPIFQVDHINGIRTDSRIENLRDVPQSENQRNKKIMKNNKSGLMGVSWHSSRERWQVSIRDNKKDVFLGMFKQAFEAFCARKSAENKYGYHQNHGRR